MAKILLAYPIDVSSAILAEKLVNEDYTNEGRLASSFSNPNPVKIILNLAFTLPVVLVAPQVLSVCLSLRTKTQNFFAMHCCSTNRQNPPFSPTLLQLLKHDALLHH